VVAVPLKTPTAILGYYTISPGAIAFAKMPAHLMRRTSATVLKGSCSSSNRRAALVEYVKRLRTVLTEHVLDVRLFGSEARGETASDSDLDVLVVVQPEDRRASLEDRIVDIAFDIDLEYDVYISPCVVTPGILNDPVWRETPFLENVLREGVPL
jgi:predicted nucleotidyltransferase